MNGDNWSEETVLSLHSWYVKSIHHKLYDIIKNHHNNFSNPIQKILDWSL